MREGSLRVGVGDDADGSAHLRLHEEGGTEVLGPTRIESTLDVGGSVRINGTATLSSGAVIGTDQTAVDATTPSKELHVIGDGSLATADEQMRVTDGASGVTLSLGADSTAAFVQATTPDAQYETLLLNPHGAPVGVGTTDPSRAMANGLTIDRPSSARLMITNQGGAAGIVMGNRDSAGVDNPLLLQAANGNLYIGDGTSWSHGEGGGWDGEPDFVMDTANGRIGVGVGYSASEALDVSGNIKASGDVTAGGKLHADGLAVGRWRLYSVAPTFATKESCSPSSPCADGRTNGYTYFQPGESKFDIGLPRVCSYFSVAVTSSYNHRNSPGLVKKEFGGCFVQRPAGHGDSYGGTSVYSTVLHNTGGQWSISDPWYDAPSNTFRVTIIDIAGRPNTAYTKIEFLGDHGDPNLSGSVYQRLPSHYTAAHGWTGADGAGSAAFWEAAHTAPVQGATSTWGHLSTGMDDSGR